MVPHDDAPYNPCSDLPPVPSGAYDPAVGALIDHLLAVQEHQSAILNHQLAIDAALSTIQTLVEELVP